MAKETAKARAQILLALLRSMQLVHHTAHWQTKGPTFAGDHALFGDLYTGLPAEADGLAEKLVYTFGADVVDLADQLSRITSICQTALEESDLFQRSLSMEEWLQKVITSTREALEADGKLSHGLDNYLQGLADIHDSACYKLKQRIG